MWWKNYLIVFVVTSLMALMSFFISDVFAGHRQERAQQQENVSVMGTEANS